MYENTQQPEQLRERYKQLPPMITELFEYETVDVVLSEVAKEFGLNDSQKTALRMEVELVLYLFLPRTGLNERLAESLEIEKSRAEQIADKLEADLFLLVDDILRFSDAQFSEEEPSIITTAPQINPSPSKTPLPDADQTEDNASVKRLRTFAMDVDWSRAHSYGAFRSEDEKKGTEEDATHRSNQDDIIKK